MSYNVLEPPIRVEGLAVARATYEHAAARGDRNVYFIDGGRLYGDVDRDVFTADGVHPNDAGMRAMADGIRPVLSRILFGTEAGNT